MERYPVVFWRHFLLVILALSLVLSISSCEINDSHLKVLYGNFYYNKGEYSEATLAYLDGLEEVRGREWILYNLANVYHAFGEEKAAIVKLTLAQETLNRDLLFRIHFNLGCIYYRQGNYQEAVEEFIHAVDNKPTDIDTKINLELSIRQLRNAQQRSETDNSGQNTVKMDVREQALRILDYIHSQEVLVGDSERGMASSTANQDW